MCLATRGTFSVIGKCKKVPSFGDVAAKIFFFYRKMLSKTHSYSTGNQLSGLGWIISKFGTEMPDIFGHLVSGLKFLNDFLVLTREPRSQRRAKNVLFHTFSDLLGHQSIPICTKTGAEVNAIALGWIHNSNIAMISNSVLGVFLKGHQFGHLQDKYDKNKKQKKNGAQQERFVLIQ